MELRHLHAFLIAAEEENLHRAGARLNRTESALSRQIKALEGQLGHALFERQGRSLHLSELGRAFQQDARDILQAVERAAERAKQVALGQVGKLTICLNATAMRKSAVLHSIRKFRRKHPQVILSLRQMTSPKQLEALRSGEIDAGFIYNLPDDAPDLDRCNIGTVKCVLALPKSHKFAARATLRLRNLAAEPFIWIARSSNASLHDRLLSRCLAGGLSPRIVQYASEFSMMLDLVSVGMGIAFAVSSIRSYQGVLFKEVRDLSVPITFDLAWRRDNRSPALAEFIKTVRPIY